MSLRFGEFELDRERRQLLRSGQPVPLEPKAYELLSLLVERRPRALSRAQIRDVVWPGVVTSESTLGVAVNAIRQALGDDARQLRFIRTVHGFGYAFCGEVTCDEAAEGKEDAEVLFDRETEIAHKADSGALVSAEQALKAAAPRRRPRWLGAAAGVVALGVAVAGWWLWLSRAPEVPTAAPKITPLTSDGGLQFSPQLSPDGDTVAYSWAGTADDNLDVYVKGLAIGARPLRLTEDPAQDWSPVWSPDGRQIAFVRDLEDGPAIFTVPWPSGQERLLTQLAGSIFECWDYYFVTTLSWSPDGDWVAYAEKPAEDEPARLVRLALATLEEQPLTTPPRGTQGDFFPAFSPDGSQLAFVRTRSWWGNQDLWVQPAGGGEPRQLTFQGYTRLGAQLVWTPDGGEILFTVLLPRHTILRVSLAGGAPQPVAGLGEGAGLPSIRGRRMVYRQFTQYPQDIWRVPGRKAPTPDREPERLIASSGADRNPDYSPDGRRIAFNSNRSGVLNVWVCDSDGSRPLQLTTHQKHSDTPRWSPDGRRILFNSNEAGVWDLYVVDVRGGIPRRLTQAPSEDGSGTWSHDGRWIYFSSDQGGERQILKIPTEGGTAVQVTQGGGYFAQESWDGRHLYYVLSVRSGIWRVPVGGGEETEVVRGPVWDFDWASSQSGIYYATTRELIPFRRSVYTISFLDFESGRVSELYRKEGPFLHPTTLAVSPDEEWILYAENPSPTSELMLVENFR